MIAADVLRQPARVLSQEQREFYFENGYLMLESFVGQDWLDRFLFLQIPAEYSHSPFSYDNQHLF